MIFKTFIFLSFFQLNLYANIDFGYTEIIEPLKQSIDKRIPVLIKFENKNCGPCKQLSTFLSANFSDYPVITIDLTGKIKIDKKIARLKRKLSKPLPEAEKNNILSEITELQNSEHTVEKRYGPATAKTLKKNENNLKDYFHLLVESFDKEHKGNGADLNFKNILYKRIFELFRSAQSYPEYLIYSPERNMIFFQNNATNSNETKRLVRSKTAFSADHQESLSNDLKESLKNGNHNWKNLEIKQEQIEILTMSKKIKDLKLQINSLNKEIERLSGNLETANRTLRYRQSTIDNQKEMNQELQKKYMETTRKLDHCKLEITNLFPDRNNLSNEKLKKIFKNIQLAF